MLSKWYIINKNLYAYYANRRTLLRLQIYTESMRMILVIFGKPKIADKRNEKLMEDLQMTQFKTVAMPATEITVKGGNVHCRYS